MSNYIINDIGKYKCVVFEESIYCCMVFVWKPESENIKMLRVRRIGDPRLDPIYDIQLYLNGDPSLDFLRKHFKVWNRKHCSVNMGQISKCMGNSILEYMHENDWKQQNS